MIEPSGPQQANQGGLSQFAIAVTTWITIALAYVRKAHAEPGMTLDSVHGPVSVSELPFSAVQAFGK